MEHKQIERYAREIDKNSPIPYYVQLKEVLLRYIEVTQMQADTQLPGEHELCHIFDLSRTVIRQTLSVLEQEGRIVRRKGKGAFIASRKITESLVQKLTGFHQDMSAKKTPPVSKILNMKVIDSDELISEKLKIAISTDVLLIERLRYVNDEPIVLVSTFLPYSLCKGVEKEDLTNQSLYELLETKYNLVIARGERTIEAVMPTKKQCKLLNIEANIPLIKLDSISYLGNGIPLEYYFAYHRADKSRFKVELVRVEEKGKLNIPLSNDVSHIPESN
jgi:GntR family transcriptional regulator